MKQITQSELNRLVQQLHDLRVALRPFAESTASPEDVTIARELLQRLEQEDFIRNAEKAESAIAPSCGQCGEYADTNYFLRGEPICASCLVDYENKTGGRLDLTKLKE